MKGFQTSEIRRSTSNPVWELNPFFSCTRPTFLDLDAKIHIFPTLSVPEVIIFMALLKLDCANPQIVGHLAKTRSRGK